MQDIATYALVDPDPFPDASSDLAVRTRLARIMAGGDFPLLSRKVAEALGTVDHAEWSLQQLTEVVLREYGLAMNVLRAANTAQHRRGGLPTESATQAIMILGVQAVRQMAGSMVLFAHFRRRSPELRRLMEDALLSAHHARAIATQVGFEDPELAQLCGMFRNLGEVLAACYFLDEYQRIRALVRDDGRSEAEALRMVLGCSYAHLGSAVAAEWALPAVIGQSMRVINGEVRARPALIADFSGALTQLLYRPAEGARAGAGLDALLDLHQPTLGITRPQVARVVAEALTETHAVFHEDLDLGDPERARDLRALREAAHGVFGSAVMLPEADEPLRRPPPDLSSRSRLLRDLQQTVIAQSGATIGTVILQALEVLVRSGPFDRAVVSFFSSDFSRLEARSGLGMGVEALLPRLVYSAGALNEPLVALTHHRQPLYLPADRALTPAERRWAQDVGVAQFGILPLVVFGKVIGSIFFGRAESGPVPDRSTLRFAQAVVDLVVEAIARRRLSS
ncbi:MAG: HDOD domain-containing protein [Gemmatimonas sp.]|jgi:HD-like signal output (HDOD) protein|uniref:HDOD domain-containing protein n=1 Tax=Gemmatimonas sp. TaxID=1962908 RepID=UPI0022C67ACA|nr:HDOD domain-containing protein [Gemmatimonas sp.]MCE2953269.1 HDOD domain-containing protein [Gemmatimonas sp.]MCZ8012553.1 HDOD domain-containing protein [Gemmatimonas sp.]MCZ8268834.1 HDOD domain-containing protein [Gemmatimonas sp.]